MLLEFAERLADIGFAARTIGAFIERRKSQFSDDSIGKRLCRINKPLVFHQDFFTLQLNFDDVGPPFQPEINLFPAIPFELLENIVIGGAHDRRSIDFDEDIADLDLDQQSLPNGVCLYNESWHQGVIGILAGRIKDQLHRPVIVFAQDRDGRIKGSARSVQGVHIRDVLDTLANRHPGIIEKFGGHAMAAGLTIRERDLEQFRDLFNDITGQFLPDDHQHGTLYTDGELAGPDLNLKLAEEIINAGPWGQGFPEPVFDGEFDLVSSRVVGEKHLKLELRAPERDLCIGAIAFNITDEDWPASVGRVHTVYRLDVNVYGGRREVQLVVEHIVPLENRD